MTEDEESIERHFNCKVCSQTHKIKLNKKLLENRINYPFPFVFLHDQINGVIHKEVLTILYIDKNLQIRHSEVQVLDDDSLFSKKQVEAITKPLLKEIMALRNEIENVTKKINNLRKKFKDKHYIQQF